MNKKAQHLIIFAIYCTFLMYVLFLRYGRHLDFDLSAVEDRLKSKSNLLPLRTVKNYITALKNGNCSLGTVLLNIAGNAVLFMPMGILLPHYSRTKSLVGFIFTAAAMITAAECLQLVTDLGRLDIDDMILNLIGAVLGYVFYRCSSKREDSVLHS